MRLHKSEGIDIWVMLWEHRMWKNILATSVLLLSASVFLQSMGSARANQNSVSFGQNPIFSKGGQNGGTLTTHTISAVSGQEILVTDISISSQYNEYVSITFTTSSGNVIGHYRTWNYSNYTGSGVLNTNLVSGLRAPEGEDVTVAINGIGSYTFSGTYIHP